MPTPARICEFRLLWGERSGGNIVYTLWTLDDNDQLAWAGDFEQGPFDTALEVAQWAWRTMARQLPPSRV